MRPLAQEPTVTGTVYESWVAMELARLLPHTQTRPRLYHWKSQHGDEVDIVLENRRGQIIGTKIKASATVGHNDTRGLRKLQALASDRFIAGLILCTAAQTTPITANMWVLPISALWS